MADSSNNMSSSAKHECDEASIDVKPDFYHIVSGQTSQEFLSESHKQITETQETTSRSQLELKPSMQSHPEMMQIED